MILTACVHKQTETFSVSLFVCLHLTCQAVTYLAVESCSDYLPVVSQVVMGLQPARFQVLLLFRLYFSAKWITLCRNVVRKNLVMKDFLNTFSTRNPLTEVEKCGEVYRWTEKSSEGS